MSIKRRDFIKRSAAAGAGLALAGLTPSISAADNRLVSTPAEVLPFKKHRKVKMGIIGVGGMGSSHVNNFLKIKKAEIRAVCDIVPEKAERIQKICKEAGNKKPDIYTNGEYDFKRLCERDDLDLIFIATPWKWHVPMCLEAMKTGKHAATEVPAALSIDDCWQLVETSEKTGLHCIMMENCNYDKIEMILLNMVKKGLFGELMHAECGYLHDLRAVKFDMKGEGLWRREHSMHRNGDLYPTHGLGPVAQYMDINRGNQFDYLVSFASKTRGLHEYAVAEYGPDSDFAKEAYVLGDVVTTLIRTMKGETIILKHDTSLPRPYSRDIMVQGTRGLARKYPDPLIHIEGMSKPHRWEHLDEYEEKYYHPLWKNMEKESEGAGHGGMDYLEDFRLIDAMVNGRAPDMDVYDAAAISAVVELSQRSISENGNPMKFPDFTRGMWKQVRELEVMKIS